MITDNDFVVTFLIIVAIVMYKLIFILISLFRFFIISLIALVTFISCFPILLLLVFFSYVLVFLGLLIDLFLTTITEEINHFIVKYFTFLVICQFLNIIPQDILRSRRQRWNYLIFGCDGTQAECSVY